MKKKVLFKLMKIFTESLRVSHSIGNSKVKTRLIHCNFLKTEHANFPEKSRRTLYISIAYVLFFVNRIIVFLTQHYCQI